MNNSQKKIQNLVNQPYKYGFSTTIETETFSPGLSEEVIQLISKKKNENFKFLSKFEIGKKVVRVKSFNFLKSIAIKDDNGLVQ